MKFLHLSQISSQSPVSQLLWDAYRAEETQQGRNKCKYNNCEVYSLLSSRTVMPPETEWQIGIEYTNYKYASTVIALRNETAQMLA